MTISNISGRSLARLLTCDPRLQYIVHDVSDIMEVSVLCGERSREDQLKAFKSGNSKVKWPNSKHNVTDEMRQNGVKSQAVDLIPYFKGKQAYDWNDLLAFARMAGVMFAVAHRYNVKLRWGGDWDQDNRSKDERFLDLGHFELIK